MGPEDGDPALFFYRFLKDWPELRARFETLYQALPGSKGAALGLAIAEVHPDFRVFLDDLHLVEDTPLMPELSALFRKFPDTGTLAIASRHQLPELQRPDEVRWASDHPLWRERPTVADLDALPQHLYYQALLMSFVGEATFSDNGWELVRRNIAYQVEGVLRLRSCWQEVVALAPPPLPSSEVWAKLEGELASFSQRHLRSHREHELSLILDRIPPEIRRLSAFLLKTDGELCFAQHKYEEARTCYQQAIALATSDAETLDFRIGLLAIAVRRQRDEEVASLLEVLEREELTARLLQKAQIGLYRGIWFWYNGDLTHAIPGLKQVLAIPAGGDRRIRYVHFRALHSLCALHIQRHLPTEALGYAQAMIELALHERFQIDLLVAFALRLRCQFFDKAHPLSLSSLLQIPNESFRAPSADALLDYLGNIEERALDILENRLALCYGQIHLREAMRAHPPSQIGVASFCLMAAHARTGDFRKARVFYEELGSIQLSQEFFDTAHLTWALLCIENGEYEEAGLLLQRSLSNFPNGPKHAEVLLFLHWLRHLQGNEAAIKEAEALLETPDGAVLWELGAPVIHNLGLRNLPAIYHFHAFGATNFAQAGSEPLRWPRRKALNMLGHLALNPEGISNEVLVRKLFPDSDSENHLADLHSLAYRLRQALKTVGAEDLLDSARGMYRFRWEKVAFCDLHEFEAFYEKARSLEADGMTSTAALFYELALSSVRGPLFEDLPDDFEEEKETYHRKIQQARAAVEHRITAG